MQSSDSGLYELAPGLAQSAAQAAGRSLTRKSGRPNIHSGCQVCGADLSGFKSFHQRYHICVEHMAADAVARKGIMQRFCQQCGRFHELGHFDAGMRSCHDQLAKHAARRRMVRALRTTPSDSGSEGGRQHPLPLGAAAAGDAKAHAGAVGAAQQEALRGGCAPHTTSKRRRSPPLERQLEQQPPRLLSSPPSQPAPGAGVVHEGSSLERHLLLLLQQQRHQHQQPSPPREQVLQLLGASTKRQRPADGVPQLGSSRSAFKPLKPAVVESTSVLPAAAAAGGEGQQHRQQQQELLLPPRWIQSPMTQPALVGGTALALAPAPAPALAPAAHPSIRQEAVLPAPAAPLAVPPLPVPTAPQYLQAEQVLLQQVARLVAAAAADILLGMICGQ